MSSSPYSPAARLLSSIWESKKSIKTLAYDKTGNLVVSKATYAQVCHVLEHQKVLHQLLDAVPVTCRNEGLLYVLLYELLLGPNQKIRGGGALKRLLMKKEADFRTVLDGLVLPSRVACFPRYVRVNTLLQQCTVEEAIAELKSQGEEEVYIDRHVPDLLVLKPGSSVHNHEWVKNGKLILQDKSSCFSALALIHGNAKCPLESDILDACAAPGNKTSHCAALLACNNNSKNSNSNKSKKGLPQVYALDRNEKRLELLNRRMKLLANHVITKHVDFLSTKSSEYKNIKGILLDPSCSGSGIFTSLDRLGDDEEENDSGERVQHLSNFQQTALQHAMTFESAERIVYSTCSIHEEENEQVVQQALASNADWQLVAPHCLREWKRRGKNIEGLSEAQSRCLIRADREDDTNGFFVAYFERKGMKAVGKGTVRNVVVPKGEILYDGQFETTTGAALAKEGTPKKVEKKTQVEKKGSRIKSPKTKHVETETTSNKKDTPPKKQERNELTVKQQEKKPSQPDKASKSIKKKEPEKEIAKKKAKKLAWKKRQLEQKQQRLLKKQAEAE